MTNKFYQLIILAAVLATHWNKNAAEFNQGGKQNSEICISYEKFSTFFYVVFIKIY